MTEVLIGLDLGGAHLKLAAVAPDGHLLRAQQVPCRLWQGLERLDEAMAVLLADVPAQAPVALTMTGELSDLFADRRFGVLSLLARMERLVGRARLHVYAGHHGLLPPERIEEDPLAAASMNWLASAQALALRVEAGLFVDMGSTTTDILPLRAGRVSTCSTTDAERLAAGELVYTGLTRTPLMALATRAPVAGRWTGVIAELFATSADAWRVLEMLDEAADQHPAADGGEKTRDGSLVRLARMVGHDRADLSDAHWQALARYFADRQLCLVEEALALQMSRLPELAGAPLVAAGAGAGLVEALARRAGRPYLSAARLVGAPPGMAASVLTCFPAVAVALLLSARSA